MDTPAQDPGAITRSLKEHSQAKGLIDYLINDFENMRTVTLDNRQKRYQRAINGKMLRDEGMLASDEGYYPIKLIHTNIKREQPQYLAYLTQSRRSAIFTNPDGSSIDQYEALEADFTTKVRYKGWEVPFIRLIDGFQCHAWDAIELTFDPSAPGHFAFEHIVHDRLILPNDTENIQAQEVVLISKNLTSYQLSEMIDNYGWNPSAVKQIIATNINATSTYRMALVTVYKVFFRENGIVHVAWYNRNVNEWLKEPEPLYMGKHDVSKPKRSNGMIDDLGNPIFEHPIQYESEYPIFVFKYEESEDPQLFQLQGRARLDQDFQEAATATFSGYVNKLTRSANMYGSPKASPSNMAPMASPKQTDVVLQNGTIFDQPMDLQYLPEPEPTQLNAIARISEFSSQEAGQVNYTVMNRKDTEKTATEITSANQEAAKLSSVQITLFSVTLCDVLSQAWSIYQNRVVQGVIEVSPNLAPLFASPNQDGSYTLAQYIVKSSGDVDVIQRAEKKQSMMQFWPVVSNTGLATVFLSDMLKIYFPEDAARYIQVLEQSANDKQLIAKLAEVINQIAVKDGQVIPELADPQHKQAMQQLLMQAQQSSGAQLQ